jgi:hypothetical protein
MGEDFGVMDETIDEGDHASGVGKDLAPFCEWAVLLRESYRDGNKSRRCRVKQKITDLHGKPQLYDSESMISFKNIRQLPPKPRCSED